MNKQFQFYTFLLTALIINVYGGDIPHGVIYRKASIELNNKTEKKLRNVLDLKLPLTNLPDNWDNKRNVIVVGNNLGKTVFEGVSRDPFEILHRINMEIPMKTLGKLKFSAYGISKPDQLEYLSSYFWKNFELEKDYKIRKLTNKEMSLIWYFIGWDLHEPIFVVEDSNHTLVFDFTATGEQLDWIEDIKDMTYTLNIGGEFIEARPVAIGDGTNNTVMFLGAGDEVFYVVE